MIGGRARRALVVLPAIVASCCRSSSIAAPRIEQAIETTFANLVTVQVARLGMRPIDASELEVTASCRREISGRDAGSGEWVCTLRWMGPNGVPLLDTFDLFVTTDGCYTATVSGESLGGPTLKRRDGGDVRNLLRAFEGCFDPT